MKFCFKKIFIGVVLFLIISFLKSCNVNAYIDGLTYRLGLSSCVDSGGTLFCSDNPSIITLHNGENFDLPKNNFIKNIYVDYGNYVYDNRDNSDSVRFLVDRVSGQQFTPLSNSCTNTSDYYYNIKNTRPIACSYDDENGNHQDCLSWFIYYQPFDNNLFYLSYPSGTGYYSSTNMWVEEWIDEEYYFYYKYTFFEVPADTYVSNLIIKYGGFGTFNGSKSDLFSGRDNNTWSNYYIDYPIVNNCTYSSTQNLSFRPNMNSSNWIGEIVPVPNFNNVDTYLMDSNYSHYNVSDLQDDISSAEASSQIEKDFAIQDRLIGYDEEVEEDSNSTFITDIASSLTNSFGSSINLFSNFLALPVNLLNENASYELMSSTPGGGATCTSYTSQYLDNGYNNIVGSVTLRLPFVHNNLTFDCTNVDIFSPYNPYFGSYHNSHVDNSISWLDEVLAPIYHIILTGLLSYWLIIAYFRFIKELYDPDNNTIEVIDL